MDDDTYQLEYSEDGEELIVTLRPWVCKVALHIACARFISYHREAPPDSLYDDDRAIRHLSGVIGEIAAELATKGDFDQVVHVYGDPGWDISPCGEKIDVKTVDCVTKEVSNPKLLVESEKALNADHYLLAVWESKDKVRIKGLAPREKVKERTAEEFPRDQMNYVVPSDELSLSA